jgi:hypothetical protein
VCPGNIKLGNSYRPYGKRERKEWNMVNMCKIEKGQILEAIGKGIDHAVWQW